MTPDAARADPARLETALNDLVCSHKMTLTGAQTAIAGDSVSTYRHVPGHDPAP